MRSVGWRASSWRSFCPPSRNAPARRHACPPHATASRAAPSDLERFSISPCEECTQCPARICGCGCPHAPRLRGWNCGDGCALNCELVSEGSPQPAVSWKVWCVKRTKRWSAVLSCWGRLGVVRSRRSTHREAPRSGRSRHSPSSGPPRAASQTRVARAEASHPAGGRRWRQSACRIR